MFANDVVLLPVSSFVAIVAAATCAGCGVDFNLGPSPDAAADAPSDSTVVDAQGDAGPRGSDAGDAGGDAVTDADIDAGPQPPCPGCASPKTCCYRGDAAATTFECSSGAFTCSVYDCLSAANCGAGSVCCFSGWTSESKPPSAVCKTPKDCNGAGGVILCASYDECAAIDAGVTCATTTSAPTPFTVCR